jgi:hypothetical protein
VFVLRPALAAAVAFEACLTNEMSEKEDNFNNREMTKSNYAQKASE